MATTEALATDQTAEGHVDEMKLTYHIKNVTKESCLEPEDLEGKDEEKIRMDDSAAEAAAAPESKEAIVSEEKLDESKIEPQAEEVKIVCPVTKTPEGNDEKLMKVEVSEVGDTSKEKQEDEKSELVAEEVKKEEVEDEMTKPEADSSIADSKEEAVSSAAVEPMVETVIPQPTKKSIEASAADIEAISVQEFESEKVPEILDAEAEQANTAELPQLSCEPVTEPPFASEPVTEPSEPVSEVKETEPPIDSKGESLLTDPSQQEEASRNVSETPVKELREGEGADIIEEVPNVPELEKVDPTAINLVPESVDSFLKLEDRVEEDMQEKAVVDEEPIMTDTTKADLKDKKDEGSDGKNKTVVDTSTDIVKEGKNNVNTETDNLVSKNTDKDVEETPAKPAKDIGDAPKMEEVRSKSSHRQSNSMFSKVKQSIVKVKKAIIGKSPSSKTIASKAKDEPKVM